MKMLTVLAMLLLGPLGNNGFAAEQQYTFYLVNVNGQLIAQNTIRPSKEGVPLRMFKQIKWKGKVYSVFRLKAEFGKADICYKNKCYQGILGPLGYVIEIKH